MFKDKVIICADCGNPFTFTAREQRFYSEKGFPNEPVRCPESPCDPPAISHFLNDFRIEHLNFAK